MPAASIERHLVRVLACISCVAVVGVLAILPYRLYSRDIRNARLHAHRVASVVHASISSAVRDGEDTTDLVNRLQGSAALELRLTRLQKGEVHPVATSGKASSTLEGTALTYIAPPIVDRSGDTWLASMDFDLSPMKRESVDLITDLVLVATLGSLLFAGVVFLFLRWAVTKPLREVTREIDRLQPDGGPLELEPHETRDMQELVAALQRACNARHTGS